jgi:CBS domain-containing protein
MNKVRQLLGVKGKQVYTISKDSTVLDGLARMAEKRIGALLVMEGEQLIGIFTERDLARRVSLVGKLPEKTYIGDVMTRELSIGDVVKDVVEELEHLVKQLQDYITGSR